MSRSDLKLYVFAEGSRQNNLGDIIQALAVDQVLRNFTNEETIWLDRELIQEYSYSDGISFVNGWFQHTISSFPAKECMNPLYFSVHLAKSSLLRTHKTRELIKLSGPIGARDYKSLWLFWIHGIPAYYSGCVTICFQRNEKERAKNSTGVIAVDSEDHPFPESVVSHIRSIFSSPVRFISHNPDFRNSLVNEYFSNARLSVENRFSNYLSADLIVTNKLHCALPCLAMGIPVVFIHPDVNDPRLSPLKELINIKSYDWFLMQSKVYGFKVNKRKLRLRKRLIFDLLKLYFIDAKNPVNSGSVFRFKYYYSKFMAGFTFFLIKLGLSIGLFSKFNYLKNESNE